MIAEAVPEPLPVGEVVCGDCLAVLRTLPDGCCDACIVDPPYGVTDLSFDTSDARYIPELLRVVKPTGQVCAFGALPTLAAFLGHWQYRWGGTWLKPNSGPRAWNAKKPKSRHEWFAVFCHPGAKPGNLTFNQQCVSGEPFVKTQRHRGWQRAQEDSLDRMDPRGFSEDGFKQVNTGTRIVTDVLDGPSKPYMAHEERTVHPTQKPLNIMRVITRWLTQPGELVIDPFGGSGTTGVAAVMEGREFILIEQDPHYCEIARARIAHAREQVANKQPTLMEV